MALPRRELTGGQLTAMVDATIAVGIGLLATLDSLEESSAYYYLSRDMDYLRVVGSLVRAELPDSGPELRELAISRESMAHRHVAAYEAECGLGDGRPLLVDSGFHGNVLAAVARRWPRTTGRLIESQSDSWPSCRTALAVARLGPARPADRKRWIETTIEAAPRRTTKVTGYSVEHGRCVVRRAPRAAAGLEEQLRAGYRRLAGTKVYTDLRKAQASVVRPLRRDRPSGAVNLHVDSFHDFRSVGRQRHQDYLVMAVRDLCADLSWRGLAGRVMVRIHTREVQSWQALAMELTTTTGVTVSAGVTIHSGQLPLPQVAVVDASLHPDPQRAVAAVLEELDGRTSSWSRAAEAVQKLRSVRWGSAFLLDIVQTAQHRPGLWDSEAVATLVGTALAT